MTGGEGDVERRVREYVSAVFSHPAADCVGQVQRLDAGENHDVYRVSMLAPEAVDVVVRIATSERARDCEIAGREARVLEKLRGVAAPVLYDFRCQSPWFDVPTTCMQFVEGAQRPPRDAEDAERLGSVVGAVHALTVDDLDSWVSPDLTLAGYLDARIVKIDERPAVGPRSAAGGRPSSAATRAVAAREGAKARARRRRLSGRRAAGAASRRRGRGQPRLGSVADSD
jgi:hypothetical protein